MQKDIQTELERTGLTRRELGHKLAKEHRGRFAPSVIRTLLDGHHLSDHPDAWEDILNVLKALPDGSPKPRTTYSYATKRISLTHEMIDHINTEFERTRLTISDVARRVAGERSFNALNNRIMRWRKGTAESVPASEWRDVLSYLATLPDVVQVSDPDRVRELPVAIEQPKRPPPKILKPKAPTKQPTLANTDDSRPEPDLLSERIPTIKPRPRLVDYRLSSNREGLGYVLIDDGCYQRLHRERKRTCVSARRLIASATEVPAGLNARTIDNWLLGNILAAESEHLEWVLIAFRNLPSVDEF